MALHNAAPGRVPVKWKRTLAGFTPHILAQAASVPTQDSSPDPNAGKRTMRVSDAGGGTGRPAGSFGWRPAAGGAAIHELSNVRLVPIKRTTAPSTVAEAIEAGAAFIVAPPRGGRL